MEKYISNGAKLRVSFAGITLKNPFIASSSGLTDSVSKVVELEKAGCGAVVLKSLFEEQILAEGGAMLGFDDYPEAYDYVSNYVRSNSLSNYLSLIEGCKKECSIPVFASINAVSTGSWTDFVAQFAQAGADGVEINLFGIPGMDKDSAAMEEEYLKIIQSIRRQVSFPIIVKISSHFTNIPYFISRLKAAGATAVVLFNRFARHTINIDTERVESTDVFTQPIEFFNTLRWISIVKRQVPEIDLFCSTGIFTFEDAVRAILSGATAVELCSTLYLNSPRIVESFIAETEQWMQGKCYKSIDEFKGRVIESQLSNPEQFERFQFMKHYSGRK